MIEKDARRFREWGRERNMYTCTIKKERINKKEVEIVSDQWAQQE